MKCGEPTNSSNALLLVHGGAGTCRLLMLFLILVMCDHLTAHPQIQPGGEHAVWPCNLRTLRCWVCLVVSCACACGRLRSAAACHGDGGRAGSRVLLPYPAPVKEEAGVDPLLLVQLVPGFDHLVRGR